MGGEGGGGLKQREGEGGGLEANGACRVGRGWDHGDGLDHLRSKKLVIESRWVSTPVAFTGQLQPRRLNVQQQQLRVRAPAAKQRASQLEGGEIERAGAQAGRGFF
eukprot:COSAG02_NODE_42274_length_386_cov_0.547038_2_plen_106_part_01